MEMKICCTGQHKPSVAKIGDAGLDLVYNGDKPFTMKRNTVFKIPTGIYVEIPLGKCGIIFERSGLGAKWGIHVLGRVIDAGYRGEIIVLLARHAYTIQDMTTGEIISLHEDLIVNPGDRIAQMVVVDHLVATDMKFVNSKEELSDSIRGASGLGSTGK